MERKEIGKIKKVSFGLGGYQDAMFGLTLEFGSDIGAWGVGHFISGSWDATTIKRSEHAKWTEAERTAHQAQLVVEISKLLNDAKVRDVMQLLNKPVEITFENNTLKEWRILKEVL